MIVRYFAKRPADVPRPALIFIKAPAYYSVGLMERLALYVDIQSLQCVVLLGIALAENR